MLHLPALASLALLTFAAAPRAQEPWLHVVGQPYDSGNLTASVYAPSSVGQPVFVLLGLDPLPLRQPVPTSIGPFYMGQILDIIGVALMPAGGWLHIPFTMPPVAPEQIGLHVPLHAYVPDKLTNPATLPFDEPYYAWSDATTITAPVPGQGAAFGDRLAVGDLNADGIRDLVVGAWSEKYQGIFFSGRVYVMWGPDLTTATALSPPVPKVFGAFGAGIVVADLNGDEVDDLVVGDGVGDPPVPGEVGKLRVYVGGRDFSDTIAFSVTSTMAIGTYGRPMAAADFDGDRHIDLAVGADLATQGSMSNAGRINVYWGPTFATQTEIWSPDPGPSAFFGSRLSSADVNGDGLQDVVEASSRDDVPGITNAGTAHVFLSPSFSTAITIANPNPQGANSRFGSAIASADFDGNGSHDLLVTDEKGNAYIFWAPSFTAFHLMKRPPQAAGGSYGYFASVGDANGDGASDIAFSNVFAGPTGGGQVFLLLAPYFATYLYIVDPESTVGDEFGWSMLFRDMDGDGREEFLTGSDFADPAGVPGAGKVTLFRP